VETLPKLTSADLEVLPEDGKLYELIEGELYVSRQPSWDHQYTCVRLSRFLDEWNEQTGLGVESPLLPGFSCQVSRLFFQPPQGV
jgi:Uma2 family endonuclease